MSFDPLLIPVYCLPILIAFHAYLWIKLYRSRSLTTPHKFRLSFRLLATGLYLLVAFLAWLTNNVILQILSGVLGPVSFFVLFWFCCDLLKLFQHVAVLIPMKLIPFLLGGNFLFMMAVHAVQTQMYLADLGFLKRGFVENIMVFMKVQEGFLFPLFCFTVGIFYCVVISFILKSVYATMHSKKYPTVQEALVHAIKWLVICLFVFLVTGVVYYLAQINFTSHFFLFWFMSIYCMIGANSITLIYVFKAINRVMIKYKQAKTKPVPIQPKSIPETVKNEDDVPTVKL
jgi:hypothetical protein